MAVPIDRDRADRAIFQLRVEMVVALRLELVELAAALGGREPVRPGLLQALLDREEVGALGAEEDVRALLHHRPGEADRIARRGHAGHRAGLARARRP